MTLTPADVKTKFARLADELEQAANPKVRAELNDLLDEVLDESLAQSGAHPANCDCPACLAVVADALARRLGEDVASVEDWGPMSVAPE